MALNQTGEQAIHSLINTSLHTSSKLRGQAVSRIMHSVTGIPRTLTNISLARTNGLCTSNTRAGNANHSGAGNGSRNTTNRLKRHD